MRSVRQSGASSEARGSLPIPAVALRFRGRARKFAGEFRGRWSSAAIGVIARRLSAKIEKMRMRVRNKSLREFGIVDFASAVFRVDKTKIWVRSAKSTQSRSKTMRLCYLTAKKDQEAR
jgi:hypothetical protein